MTSRDNAPSNGREKWDAFFINHVGLALTGAIGAASTLAVAGPSLLVLGAGLVAVQTIMRQRLDIPAMMAQKNRHNLLPEHDPLYQMTKRLAKDAGLQNPPRCLVQRNAMMGPYSVPFAGTIGTPESSIIILSPGIETKMTPSELEGVLAHEIAHIKNSDTKRMTWQQGIAQLSALPILYVGVSALFSILALGPVVPLTGAAVAFGGFAATLGVQAATSRAIERRADRDSAKITKNPWALASALGRIVELQMNTMRNMGKAQKPGPFKRLLVRVLRTHPNTGWRKSTLEKIGEDMIARDPSLEQTKKRTIAEAKVLDTAHKLQKMHRASSHPHDSLDEFDDDNVQRFTPSPQPDTLASIQKNLPFNKAAKEQDNNLPEEHKTAEKAQPDEPRKLSL